MYIKQIYFISSVVLIIFLNSCGGGGSSGGVVPISSAYSYIPTDINDSVAIRFLNKATFGASSNDVLELKKDGVVKWIDKQLALPLEEDIYLKKMISVAKQCEPDVNSESASEYIKDNDTVFNKNKASFHSPRYRMSSWFDNALRGDDQLRHKMAYALSQIIVESDFEPIFTRRAEALARYFDILYKNSFGTYKQLLSDMSFNSGMGLFLTFNGNKKLYQNDANISVYPDENYAREIMQLFSIGLNKLNIDATPKVDAQGNLIPTYTQDDVNELARVFTGWDIQRNRRFGRIGFVRGDLTHPLEFTSKYHDFGQKKLLGSTIKSGLSGEEDIKRAVEIIMSQDSVAPYISKNLIMRFVKSNPSKEYVARVSKVFKDSKGDLKEVVKAILLDQELWEDIKEVKSSKFKEPLIAYTQFLRALKAKPYDGWYFCNYGGPSDDNASNCQRVYDSFLFNSTTSFLGQGAGLAPNVFNFYDNSYIPNDTNFQAKGLVAPELQIQSDTVLINFSNRINSDLAHWEKGYLLEGYYKDKDGNWQKYKDLADVANHAPSVHNIPVYYVGADKMLLDAQEEYDVLEKVIDGDTDGDFANLQDFRETDYHGDEKALKALISFENMKLTAGALSAEEELIIYESLKSRIYNKYNDYDLDEKQENWAPRSKKYQLYNNVILPVIRAIVTSDAYMVE